MIKKQNMIMIIIFISLTITKVVLEFYNQNLTSKWADSRNKNKQLTLDNKKLKFELQTLLNQNKKYNPKYKVIAL